MNRLLLSLLSLLLFAGAFAQEPVFVGHRGASYLAPENTLASFNLAWELGAEAAECDIMLTADNQVVIFHDKKGKRLTGSNFTVKESKYDDIKTLPIKLRESNLEKYSNEHIPLLSEVLQTIPDGRTLVIEIKTGPEILPYLKDILNEYWKTGSIALISFDFDAILAAKDLFPEIPCFYLSMFTSDVKKKFDQIKTSKLDGVNLRHKIIDKELVSMVKAADKDIWCWTVNEPKDAERMILLGVSAITTDRPKWLEEQVR